MELHEKPSPWSETWLDPLSVGQISFGGADVKVANEVDEGRDLERPKVHMMTHGCPYAAQNIDEYHDISTLDY